MNLDHPNLSRLLGYGCSQLVVNDDPSGDDQLFVVTKFEPNGDLFDCVISSVDGFPAEIARQMFL